MAAKRFTKGAVDWSKFAKLVPESERQSFNQFKGRSDAYLRKMMSYPENPPAIDFNYYRSRLAQPAVVDQLEQSYKTLSIPYPKDTRSHEVDEQEKDQQKLAAVFCSESETRIKEAQTLNQKFKDMIPVPEMTLEDWALTFPDWTVRYQDPSIWPHPEKAPGLNKEQVKEHAKPDPPPYAIP